MYMHVRMHACMHCVPVCMYGCNAFKGCMYVCVCSKCNVTFCGVTGVLWMGAVDPCIFGCLHV